MIPSSCIFDQATLAALLEHDPVVVSVRTFFAELDWSLVERWETQQFHRGRPAHPESAYLKAFLLRICQQFQYTTQLRAFLIQHPLLVVELGFRLVLDPSQPYGFDVERTLPTRFWLGEKLRHLDLRLFTELLASTVKDLQAEIPGSPIGPRGKASFPSNVSCRQIARRYVHTSACNTIGESFPVSYTYAQDHSTQEHKDRCKANHEAENMVLDHTVLSFRID